MTALASALLAELSDADLDALAELLAPRLAGRLGEPASVSPWLTTAGAAAYLAAKPGRIHDLVQLGHLMPCRDGRRLLFKQADLDAYLEASA